MIIKPVNNTKKEEKYSKNDKTNENLLWINTGMTLILLACIIYDLCKRYGRKKGFLHGHSEKLSQENLLEAGNFSLMSSASDEYLLPLSSHGRRREDMIKLEYENYRKTFEIFQRKIEELQKANEEYRKEIERRKRQYKSDWRKAALYADWRKEEFLTVHVTLDADTAHPTLLLMAKGREVTCQEWCQDLPNTAQRFDTLPCVLGQSGITSGRCFWEVKVGDAGSWDLGICRDNVTRKGRVTMSPENGFWAIRLYEGEYWALTSPETPLPLREYPHNVGIFLDYEAGDISFYNMTDGSHIFTFPQNTFYGVLRPLFRLWPSDPATLTIV